MATTTSDACVILSVQMLIAGQRAEIVIPFGDSANAATLATICKDVVDGFETVGIPALIDCLSNDSQVVGLSAEAMIDGGIPFRRNYALGTNVGTIAHPCVPQQVAALTAYYPNPDDLTVGNRVRVGKNFIPGVPETNVAGEIIDAALQAALQAFADLLVAGINGLGAAFYQRVINTDRTPGATIYFALLGYVRDYVGTIKRRLLPH